MWAKGGNLLKEIGAEERVAYPFADPSWASVDQWDDMFATPDGVCANTQEEGRPEI